MPCITACSSPRLWSMIPQWSPVFLLIPLFSCMIYMHPCCPDEPQLTLNPQHQYCLYPWGCLDAAYWSPDAIGVLLLLFLPVVFGICVKWQKIVKVQTNILWTWPPPLHTCTMAQSAMKACCRPARTPRGKQGMWMTIKVSINWYVPLCHLFSLWLNDWSSWVLKSCLDTITTRPKGHHDQNWSFSP